jgi:hypothetical protein
MIDKLINRRHRTLLSPIERFSQMMSVGSDARLKLNPVLESLNASTAAIA